MAQALSASNAPVSITDVFDIYNGVLNIILRISSYAVPAQTLEANKAVATLVPQAHRQDHAE